MITEDMIKEYVKQGGAFCPFCKSDNIEAIGGWEMEGEEVTEEIMCNSCGETWTDVYVLTSFMQ